MSEEEKKEDKDKKPDLIKDGNTINSNVVFVHDERPIAETVAIMVEKQISSVLIHDVNKKVIGIMTERDVFRKFTLLEMDDKMTRSVATIMTRGVLFVTLEKMEKQIIDYHINKKIRHFPLLKGKEQTIENVIGIISITDFMRQFLLGKKKQIASNNAEIEVEKPIIGIMAKPNFLMNYKRVFSELGFNVVQITDFNEFYKEHQEKRPGIIFDLDGYSQDELKKYIVLFRKYPGKQLYCTSNINLFQPFRRGLKAGQQSIALKPLDFSFAAWFLREEFKS